jgi:hypothetical protein
MKYAVINPKAIGASKIIGTCRWEWMARLYVWLTHATFAEIVHVDTSTREVMRLIDERNAALARGDALTNALFPLVARGDGGEWRTVHEADTVVDHESMDILDEAFS